MAPSSSCIRRSNSCCSAAGRCCVRLARSLSRKRLLAALLPYFGVGPEFISVALWTRSLSMRSSSFQRKAFQLTTQQKVERTYALRAALVHHHVALRSAGGARSLAPRVAAAAARALRSADLALLDARVVHAHLVVRGAVHEALRGLGAAAGHLHTVRKERGPD